VGVRTGLHLTKGTIARGPRGGNVRRARSTHPPLSVVHTPGADDARILSSLLSAIGSTARTSEFAQRAVDTLVASGAVQSAHVYLYRPIERHLLRVAVAPLSGAGESDLAHSYLIGAGVIGASAMRPDRPTIAPAELRGATSRSGPRPTVIAIPINARNGDALGVLASVAADRCAPGSRIARLTHDVARIVGLVIEHEAMATSAARHSEVGALIDTLARSAELDVSLSDSLAEVAATGLRALATSACAIYRSDRGASELRLLASAPRDAGLPSSWHPQDVVLSDGARSVAAGHNALGLALSESAYATFAVASLASGTTDRVVVIAADEQRAGFDAAELQLCQRIAGVAAALQRQRRLADYAMERRRPGDLLWDLLTTIPDRDALIARAQRLGCDLVASRVVLVASATGAAGERIRSTICALDRGALVDVGEEHLVAIISASAAAAITDVGADAGLSQACDDVARYRVAYQQAQEALALGTRLFGHGHLTRHDELGSYRFVPALIASGLTSENTYQKLQHLSDELLRTLEAYLDCGGNTALAAKQLYLHRNTLRQRLERISALIDLDLARPTGWLPLNLAIKTARMSRLGAAARSENGPR